MKTLRSTRVSLAVRLLPFIVAIVGTIGIAAAQQPTPDQQATIKANCRSDFMANCMGVPRGGKEAFQCLQKNLASLSAGCQQAIKAVTAAAAPPAPAAPAKPAAAAPAPAPAPAATTQAPAATQPAKTATPAPASTPPAAAPAEAAKTAAPAPTAPPAQAAPAKKAVATPQPAAAPPPAAPAAAPAPVIVVAPRQVFFLVRTSCRSDYRTYCSNVDIGGGRVVACLQANAASLSPTCKSALADLGR